ncbi:hypothetical protein [Streptomyces sp. NPDC058476]|uniref:hypothetical protein n=1 Tax=Streptomyces sp. NPDC058476 TaxID=3346519 RepID=UPI00365E4195
MGSAAETTSMILSTCSRLSLLISSASVLSPHTSMMTSGGEGRNSLYELVDLARQRVVGEEAPHVQLQAEATHAVLEGVALQAKGLTFNELPQRVVIHGS